MLKINRAQAVSNYTSTTDSLRATALPRYTAMFTKVDATSKGTIVLTVCEADDTVHNALKAAYPTNPSYNLYIDQVEYDDIFQKMKTQMIQNGTPFVAGADEYYTLKFYLRPLKTVTNGVAVLDGRYAIELDTEISKTRREAGLKVTDLAKSVRMVSNPYAGVRAALESGNTALSTAAVSATAIIRSRFLASISVANPDVIAKTTETEMTDEQILAKAKADKAAKAKADKEAKALAGG